jgi:hypothetical protein
MTAQCGTAVLRPVRLTELEQEKTSTKWDRLRQRRPPPRGRIALLSVKGRYLGRHRRRRVMNDWLCGLMNKT